jgi:hypothetical protein
MTAATTPPEFLPLQPPLPLLVDCCVSMPAVIRLLPLLPSLTVFSLENKQIQRYALEPTGTFFPDAV